MLFQFPGSDGVRYCFLLSDKLEPFIIIVAVSPQYGKLRRLQPHHIEDLHTAIVAFKDRYGVLNVGHFEVWKATLVYFLFLLAELPFFFSSRPKESYHYTPLDDREEADSLAASGQLSYSSKAHSTHFHLKIRVATGMYKERFPVLQLVDFDKLRECTDHVKYNYRRETVSWAEVKAMMERDVLPA